MLLFHNVLFALFLVVRQVALIVDEKKTSTNSSNANDDEPLLTDGTPTCTNGLNRCVHVWENQYKDVVPYESKGVCSPKEDVPLDDYATTCQFNSDVGVIAMILNCGGPGNNVVQIIYNNQSTETSNITAVGSARAVYSRVRPKDLSMLRSGDIVATDAYMDLWVYCYDRPALMRFPSSGTMAIGMPKCNEGDGQVRCLSSFRASYTEINPVTGDGKCLEKDVDTDTLVFVDSCRLSQQNAVRWTLICDPRGESGLDISYDSEGNGKVITKGRATALFAQQPPKLTDLRSGTVTSSVLNENVYLFCPTAPPT